MSFKLSAPKQTSVDFAMRNVKSKSPVSDDATDLAVSVRRSDSCIA
eukprot:CAMPEP_0172732588 /NCGR_PEP_ID=MMETSP1074-20121228/104810_1 /TAXON_ID=2916 /ORGANISM="Ceratium fusus, Strain PA161109" /LENGTH=45 /DNA_ID= /DNA_START= /DNA_END= /DNA_ORIENTATION=